MSVWVSDPRLPTVHFREDLRQSMAEVMAVTRRIDSFNGRGDSGLQRRSMAAIRAYNREHAVREQLVQLLFEKFNIFYASEQAVLSLYAVGRISGCTVDIGHGKIALEFMDKNFLVGDVSSLSPDDKARISSIVDQSQIRDSDIFVVSGGRTERFKVDLNLEAEASEDDEGGWLI